VIEGKSIGLWQHHLTTQTSQSEDQSLHNFEITGPPRAIKLPIIDQTDYSFSYEDDKEEDIILDKLKENKPKHIKVR
jgi:hypothetical protein